MKLIQLFEDERVSRAKAMHIVDALNTIERECSKTLSKVNETPIYRGANMGNSPIYFGSTEGTIRKSANTQNYYTLIVDNHSNWKNYPKRSQSFICTTSDRVALGYGDPYLVIPFDNANIGICPDSDYWTSFEKSFVKLKINGAFYSLVTLNGFADKLLKITEAPSVETYEEVKRVFSKISYESVMTFLKDNDSAHILRFGQYYSNELTALKKFNSLFDMYIQILSPTENDFKHQTASNFSVSYNSDKELFIEGKCIFLNQGFYNRLKENEKELVDNVLGKYHKIMKWIKN